MHYTKMTWGVKESFRQYVEAAGGSITISDGATQNADGSFLFNAETEGDLAIASDGSVSGSQAFAGTVSFEAHGGMLKSTLSGLAIESAPEGLMLSALEGPMNESRCHIAKLAHIQTDNAGNPRFSAEITLDGMFQIADNYPPGTALDEVTLS